MSDSRTISKLSAYEIKRRTLTAWTNYQLQKSLRPTQLTKLYTSTFKNDNSKFATTSDMSPSRYIRPFDPAEAVNFGLPKYDAQTLYDHQSALFLAIFLEEGGCGPSLHYHHSDQIYFVTQGSVEILLDNKTYDVPPGSLIFIPAGLPHKNFNNGKGTEKHLEMQFPSPPRFEQLGYYIDGPEDVPEKWQTKRKAYMRTIANLKAVETPAGAKIIPLADASSGSDHVHIHHEEVSPDQGNSSKMHISDFDRYHFVLEGELTVEIAFKKYTAGTETLVILPAGLPYRQYNAGPATVKQLILLVPPPTGGVVRDTGVSFAPSGDDQEQRLLEADSSTG